MCRAGQLRIPTALIRDSGVAPTKGLKIELVDRMVRVSQGDAETGQMPDARGKSVHLSGHRVQTVLNVKAFSAIVGHGYVLVGTLDD